MRSARIRILILMLADVLCFTLIPIAVIWCMDAFFWEAPVNWKIYLRMWPFIGVFVGCNIFIRLTPMNSARTVKTINSSVISMTYCLLSCLTSFSRV